AHSSKRRYVVPYRTFDTRHTRAGRRISFRKQHPNRSHRVLWGSNRYSHPPYPVSTGCVEYVLDMFARSGYPAPVLKWRQGSAMSGFLTFMDRYRDEAACVAALAELRWPQGFVCAGCAGRLAYQLTARPRVFE